MVLWSIALAVVIFFVIGVAFIYRGYRHTPDPATTVPKDQFSKLAQDLEKTGSEREQLKLKLDAMVVQLDDSRNRILDAEKIKASLAELQEQEKAHSDSIRHLEGEKQFIFGKADSQAREAVQVMTELLAENEALKQELMNAENKIDPEDLARLNTVNQSLREQVDQHLAKIREMEESIAQAQKKMSEEISLEKQKALDELTQAQATIRKLESEISALRSEREQAQDRLTALEASLAETKNQLDSRVPQPQDEASLREAKQWQEERAQMEKTVSQLQALNQNLAVKEKVILSQLTKSRAQAMGLEKICASYKEQLENVKPA